MRAELIKLIRDNAFYSNLVLENVLELVASETVFGFLLDSTTSFENDGLVRQQLILVVTPTRLLVCFTEELPAGMVPDNPANLRINTESVPLSKVGTCQAQKYYQVDLERPDSSPALNEVIVSLNWTSTQTIDFGPASCDDPECQNEHGYTGQIRQGDYSAKYSVAADGEYWVEHALAFVSALDFARTSGQSDN